MEQLLSMFFYFHNFIFVHYIIPGAHLESLAHRGVPDFTEGKLRLFLVSGARVHNMK
jgi:hypothetical protein